MSFPCIGDINTSPCACAPSGWEEYHSHVWNEFWNHNGKIVWMEFSFDVLPPFDHYVTLSNMRMVIEDLFFEHLHEGAPLRMCFMNKAKRVAGIPVLWQYKIYLEYHESPAVPVAIALEGFFGLIALLGVAWITYKLINSGVIEKIGDHIITPAIMGTAMIFILGIGFIFVLSYLQPGLRATARPPKVPGAGLVPVGEVSVGPVPATRRRA